MLLALSVVSQQAASLGSAAYKVFDQRGGSIGRLDGNDWTLPDAEKIVSTRHAVVRCAEGAYYLDDTSTNGTFINAPDQAMRAAEPVCLQDGDRIFIGNYEILVQLIEHGEAVEQEAAAQEAAALAQATEQHPPHQQSLGEPAEAPRSVARADASPQDLLTALGLDPASVGPGIYGELGSILRTVVQGLIDLLRSRAEVKSRFRMSVTQIRAVENNPLKFSIGAREALNSLFVQRNPGYLPAAHAFREGLDDLAFHQLAMLAGVRAGFKSMLAGLHPDRLEAQFERRLERASVIPLGRRLRFWGMYRAQFEDFETDAEAHFQLLFGEEFARAYDEQMQKLTAAARQERT